MTVYTWRSIAWLALGILLALGCAEMLIGRVYEAPAKRQVVDGINELKRTPNILAVSSSHGRSFHVLGQALEEKSNGKTDLIAVPLEAGKVHAMEWLLDRRLKPLVLNGDGKVKEPLSHLIFGVTWWDTCRREEPTETANNIVTHGWTLRDYARDFATVGATELNRNFVRNQWRHWFSHSALVETRFAIKENFNRFTNFLRVMISGHMPDDEYQQTLSRWRSDIESGHECYLSELDMQAMDRFVAFANEHDLDLTLVLFPLKPDTITETALKDTIEPFARAMKAYGNAKEIRVVDMTLGLLQDGDFMLDLDHVNAAGNLKWADKALKDELSFLLNVDTAGDKL